MEDSHHMSVAAVHQSIQYELHHKAGLWFWTFQPRRGPRRFGRLNGDYEKAVSVVQREIEVSLQINAA
jgi:hypothetical protein